MRNPLSIEAFIDWCKKKPAGAVYNYNETRYCAYCRYLRFLGFPRPIVIPGAWLPDICDDGFTQWRRMPYGLEPALQAAPHTYAALADRLEKCKADS